MGFDVHELLAKQLPTDNPVALMELIAESESYGDTVAQELKKNEVGLAHYEAVLDREWQESMDANSKEKVAVAEARAKAATADTRQKVSEYTAEIKYLKKVGQIIENRCSVGQSFLSHSTAMIKASIGVPNVR